jgi:hypothetical protein
MQNEDQKMDLEIVCGRFSQYRALDYVSAWFFKASTYINTLNIKCAFVSTNSICQGEQVSMLWGNILLSQIEICFGYNPFVWTNSAKGKAGVTVIIVGLRLKSNLPKYIFNNNSQIKVENINPYLKSGSVKFLENRTNPISNIPSISSGNYTGHAQPLILSDDDKKNLLLNYPQSKRFLKKMLGSQEFLHNESRWCLWIKNDDREIAESIPEIRDRIERVKIARLQSKDKSANILAKRPHQFRDIKETKTTSVIIPTVSSERRYYIPIGFIDSSIIVSNRNHIIYDSEVFIFSIVSSRMHNQWVSAVAGRMRMDINYSSDMCYNNFPFPNINHSQKTELENSVFKILEEREKHSEKTLAQLYDPDKMPDGLGEAHRLDDLAVERCYRLKPFDSDEERLEYLFKLYEQMIAKEKEQGTLFESIKKKKK